MLAHNAAVLGVPYDSWRLFTERDPLHIEWLEDVVRQVRTTHQKAEAKHQP